MSRMQDRPTASELLATIAELLENEVLAATKGGLQHQVRVAGNLCRILEREARLGAAADAREVELLASALGEAAAGRDALALSQALVARLDAGADAALAAARLARAGRDRARQARDREARPRRLGLRRRSWIERPPTIGAGLAAFLAKEWGAAVEVENLGVASAGARRRNVLFDALRGGERIPLVATIIPSAAVQIMPIEVEASNLRFAEAAGMPAPHVFAVCDDASFVGGPFFVTARVAGETIPRQVLRLVEKDPALGPRLARQCGDALAQAARRGPRGRAPAHRAPGRRPDRDVAARRRSAGARAAPALARLHARAAHARAHPPAAARAPHRGARRLPQRQPDRRPRRPAAPRSTGRSATSATRWRTSAGSASACGASGTTRSRWAASARAPTSRPATRPAGGRFEPERFHWWKTMGTLRWGLGLAGQAKAHLDGSVPSIVMAASGRRVAELEWDVLMLLRGSFGRRD